MRLTEEQARQMGLTDPGPLPEVDVRPVLDARKPASRAFVIVLWSLLSLMTGLWLGILLH